MAKVLVIDDEQMIGEIASRILKRAGHSVVIAHSGDEAVATAASESINFDLVIIDERMPGLSAMETIRLLRERQPHLPMILSSGYRVDMQEYKKHFGSSLSALPKPYRSDELVKVVADLLKKDSDGSTGGGSVLSMLFLDAWGRYLRPHVQEIKFA